MNVLFLKPDVYYILLGVKFDLFFFFLLYRTTLKGKSTIVSTFMLGTIPISTYQDLRAIFYKAFSFKIRRIKTICSFTRVR